MSNINKKTADALNSIAGIVPAMPAPFLLTRLHAAMHRISENDATVWSKIALFLKRPAVAFTILLVLICVNIFVLNSNGFLSSKKNVVSKVNSNGYDIAINVTSIYDTENQEP